uniref:Uncharacterized protein n=1 Tax=Anguilla anguilla TaxID=7936 RepID=A0A0E9V882_ANGAN
MCHCSYSQYRPFKTLVTAAAPCVGLYLVLNTQRFI